MPSAPTRSRRAEPVHFFAYGTLMDAAVLAAATGLRLAGAPAQLDGHRRCALHGLPWPALVPDVAARVDGVLYRDLSPPAFAALDAFEGADYRRVAVHVRAADGRLLPAQAYLWQGPAALLAGDWDFAAFLARDRQALLDGAGD